MLLLKITLVFLILLIFEIEGRKKVDNNRLMKSKVLNNKALNEVKKGQIISKCTNRSSYK